MALSCLLWDVIYKSIRLWKAVGAQEVVTIILTIIFSPMLLVQCILGRQGPLVSV